jgi:uncharacterized protein (DUF697 family)
MEIRSLKENTVSSWNDLGNAWKTLREINVDEIRRESEQSLSIACIGSPTLLEIVTELLHCNAAARYQPVWVDPLRYYNPPLVAVPDNFRHSDLLLLVIDGRQQLPRSEMEMFNQLEAVTLPLLVVVLYSDRLPEFASGNMPSVLRAARTVTLADPFAAGAADMLASAILETIPGELCLAAARQLPGLRSTMAHELINSTSFTNATYTLAAGLPQQIPILSIPFATADILVLTKNQALLVYKLALCYGAPPDFQERIREILPVIGGGYFWRQMARSLVGVLPLWGLIPQIAVAYAGTYTTGMVAWRWYASSEPLSHERIRQIMQEGMQLGQEQARKLLEQARAQSSQAPGRVRALLTRRRGLSDENSKQMPEE